MDKRAILQLRLQNQLLTDKPFKNAADVVTWFGAVQSQDFEGAKWGVAQRINDPVHCGIQGVFDNGQILRTHVLRPTWHFVSPPDIKWMLKLTAPRILAACATVFRQVQLSDKIFKRSNRVIEKTLNEGARTRGELKKALEQKGIRTDDIRLICILMRAELDALICSGPRHGNQFSYMLLDQRVSHQNTLRRDESLAELAKRYFQSHGPATIKDFAWWSGLTVSDAKKGLESIKSTLAYETIDKEVFWYSSGLSNPKAGITSVHLLPAFDEYTVAYKNRQPIIHPRTDAVKPMEVLGPTILNKGYVVGTWKRTINKGVVSFRSMHFIAPPVSLEKRIRAAAREYANFLGKKLTID